MRPLFLFALLLFQTPLARSDEQTELEFVRGLRARGMPDLALQYLERLRSKSIPTLAAVLPLEFAKTRLEIAATLPEARNRAVLQQEARRELEAFLRSSPKHPLAPEAALQLARVSVLQGKARLSAARRADVRGNRQAEFAQARAQLEEAGTRLRAALGKLDAQSAAGDLSAAEKQELGQSRQQAELERGINLLEQAQTYFDQNEFQKRGELIKDAIGILEKVSRR
jgi:hypothetical protein